MAFTLSPQMLSLILTGAQTAGSIFASRAQKGGVQRAADISQQSSDAAIRTILGLYDEGRASLQPYANLGPAAINKLQSIAYHGNIPAPASITPYTPTAP